MITAEPDPQPVERAVERDVERLLGELTMPEKLSMLSGDRPFFRGVYDLIFRDGYRRHTWSAGSVERLGIPGIHFLDGPRGIVLPGSTTFPVPMARAATFDPALEEEIGTAIGRELRAHGGNLFGGICINLLRHPAWGRAQETYGEDPVVLGAFGAALCRGVQHYGMACVKHFAANSMENARFRVDVAIAPRPLHELYLPHFEAVVRAGVAAVMSAYNSVNGEWCGQNRTLLTDILRDRWGFRGFVLTDFVLGMRDAKTAIEAGQDLEMPFRMQYHARLGELVERGEVPTTLIDRAVARLLRSQLRAGRVWAASGGVTRDVLACPEHTALARRASERGIVLLANEGSLLPLEGDERIAVIGRLAATPNLGDRGSSDGRPPYVVTPLDALRAAARDPARVVYLTGEDVDAACDAARAADVAVVVVGYTHEDEGEHITPPDLRPFVDVLPTPGPRALQPLVRWAWRWVARLNGPRRAKLLAARAGFGAGGDRRSLDLRPSDEALIRATVAANPRTVVVMMAGSAVTCEAWRARVPAILMLWYPGMEGGHALAAVLFGRVCPSGRMPFSTPVAPEHLPDFDPTASNVRYDLWHGYRKLDRDGHRAAFPFGFGLSYTTFTHGPPRLRSEQVTSDDTVEVRVDVTNNGTRDGDEVVFLFATPLGSAVERAPKELRAFERIHVPAGATREVVLVFPAAALAYFDEATAAFVVEAIDYELIVARHAGDPDAQRVRLRVR